MIDDLRVYSLDLRVKHLYKNSELDHINEYTLIRKPWLECKKLISDLWINWYDLEIGRRSIKSYDPCKKWTTDVIIITIVKFH